jgi:hypothetical protein
MRALCFSIVILGCMTFIKAEERDKISIKNYYETEPLTFEDIGFFQPIVVEFKVEIVINVEKISQLANDVVKNKNDISNDCQNNYCRQIIESIDSKMSNVENKLHTISAVATRRVKRWLDDGLVPQISGVMRLLTGSMDVRDREVINIKISNLKNQQIGLINQTNEMRKIFNETFNQLKDDVTKINEISDYLKTVEYKKNKEGVINDFIQKLRSTAERLTISVDAIIELILTKRIHGNIIAFDQIENILKKLQDKLRRDQEFPFETSFEILKQQKVEVEVNKNQLVASFIMPATKQGKWRIFKIYTKPIMANGMITMMELKEKFLVISKSGEITTLSSINECIKLKNKNMIGKFNQPIYAKEKDTCLTKAFRKKHIDMKLCKADTYKAKLNGHLIIKTEENNIIVFTQNSITITSNCEGTESKTEIKNNSVITINGDCQIRIDNLIFLGVEHQQTRMEIKTLKVNINATELMMEKPKAIPTFDHINTMNIDNLGKHIKSLNEMEVKNNYVQWIVEKKRNWFVAIGSALTSTSIMLALVLCICICLKI